MSLVSRGSLTGADELVEPRLLLRRHREIEAHLRPGGRERRRGAPAVTLQKRIQLATAQQILEEQLDRLVRALLELRPGVADRVQVQRSGDAEPVTIERGLSARIVRGRDALDERRALAAKHRHITRDNRPHESAAAAR